MKKNVQGFGWRAVVTTAARQHVAKPAEKKSSPKAAAGKKRG